jgi:hypothetical protein
MHLNGVVLTSSGHGFFKTLERSHSAIIVLRFVLHTATENQVGVPVLGQRPAGPIAPSLWPATLSWFHQRGSQRPARGRIQSSLEFLHMEVPNTSLCNRILARPDQLGTGGYDVRAGERLHCDFLPKRLDEVEITTHIANARDAVGHQERQANLSGPLR